MTGVQGIQGLGFGVWGFGRFSRVWWGLRPAGPRVSGVLGSGVRAFSEFANGFFRV